jgi:hypothetical protein
VSEESITKSELLRILPMLKVSFKDAISGAWRGGTLVHPSIVADIILSKREPDYVEGSHYIDAEGWVFQFDVKHDGTKRWWGIGTLSPLAFDRPQRPLRKVT